MVIHHSVDGYAAFCEFIKTIDTKKGPYYILYTGSLTNGKSWCPDCVEADPVVESVLETAPKNANFVTVFVGDRETWKNPNCGFRTDKNTKLMVIPTLVRWNGPQRLDGEKCANKELVEMVITDFDED